MGWHRNPKNAYSFKQVVGEATRRFTGVRSVMDASSGEGGVDGMGCLRFYCGGWIGGRYVVPLWTYLVVLLAIGTGLDSIGL